MQKKEKQNGVIKCVLGVSCTQANGGGLEGLVLLGKSLYTCKVV